MDRILASKLCKPAPVPDLVSRPHLVERLEAVPFPPLTSISAPAGFGKTMLLAEWCATTQQEIAWLSLDPLDSQSLRFVGHLIEALRSVAPGIGEGTLADLRSADPPPLEILVADVIHDIDENGRPIRLVIDDHHVLRAEEPFQVLRILAESRTPHLGLVLSGRSEPDLPLARLRLQGDLLEIRAEDLRFRREEIATFLRSGQEFDVSDATVASMDARTEGWIAGIRMACHSLEGEEDVETRLVEFSGQDRLLIDYLLDEVLSGLDEERRDFLVRTSILERLQGRLCDAVIGTEGGQERLEELERSNLFLVAIDRNREWYRYHHLFADLLRSRLGELPEKEVRALHRRASEWFHERSMDEEALHHAIESRDWPWTLQLLEPRLREIFEKGSYQRILRWLEEIPAEVRRENPRLVVQHGWALSMAGRVDAVGEVLEELRSIRGPDAAPEELGEIDALETQYLRFRGDLDGAFVTAERCLERLPESRAAERSVTSMARGTLLRFQGRLEEALEPLESAIRLGERADSDPFRFGAMNVLSGVDTDLGRLHRAARRTRDVISQCATGRPSHVIESHAVLGNILREWNRLDEAEQVLRSGIEIATRRGVEKYWPHSFFNLARVQLARGDRDRAFDEVAFALRQAEQRGYARGLRHVRAERARIHQQGGDLDTSVAWLREGEFGPTDDGTDVLETLVRGRVLGASGRSAEAAELLRSLEARLRDQGRRRDLVELLVLRSLHDPRTEGDEALVEAVTVGDEFGMVRVFLDEGTPLLERLTELAPRCAPARKVVAQFGVRAADPGHRLAEPLSERELEVLHQIEAGLSNQEIGRALYVSPNTVKTHIQRIFGKLSVRSRTQAVAAARSLDIIE